ncbi:MAG TPA: phage major capsid protein, partial [Desulfobacterales bacterium]|nr:phage major capsid protein [Desulfobacterales bacterium]
MPEKNLKELIEELGKTFEEFKKANDARIKELEEKGTVDPLLSEKVEKINTALTDISNMKKQVEQLETVAARGIYPGGDVSELGTAKKEHKAVFEKWFRKGGSTSVLRDLEVKAELTTLSDPDGGYVVAP